MSPDLLIRRAEVWDAAAIAVVHVRSWQVAYRGLLPDETLDNLSVEQRSQLWSAERWHNRAEGRSLLVAEVDGEIIGFVATGPARDQDAGRDVAEVYAIYVDPSRWGQGAGRALMERSLDELRESGFEVATLWVLESNRRARRFYEIGGWETDSAHRVERLREGGAEAAEVRYQRRLYDASVDPPHDRAR